MKRAHRLHDVSATSTRRHALKRFSLIAFAASGCLPLHEALAADADGQRDDFFRYVEMDLSRDVQRMLDKGFDVNTLDAKGQSALYVALREKSNATVEVLLKAPGLHVDVANGVGETPLMMAALRGRADVMARLIAMGAKVNRDGWSPLHYAASGGDVGAINLLLAQGALLNARAPNGNTPLMMAAGYGTIDGTRELMRWGADACLVNKAGRNAADYARANDHDLLGDELDKACFTQGGGASSPGR
jgi:uncharacterized protein